MLSDQLRYFMAAAKHEHLGRASEELELSQPALSRSILKLEEELGVQLFDRAGRGIRLNASGKILLRRIERAAAEFDDARRELEEHTSTLRRTISIGYLATFGVWLVPELVKRIRLLHPAVRFKLLESPSPVLRDLLIAGEIDLCLSSPQFIDPLIEWRPLFREDLFALVPPDHRLAGRQSIDLVELADEPFVALKAGHGLRQTIEMLCHQAGFSPRIEFEGYEVATLRGLVGAGLGVTLAPKREVAVPTQAVTLPVANPCCQRPVGLSWRKNRWLSPDTLRFRDYILKNLHSRDLQPATGSGSPNQQATNADHLTAANSGSI
ncbi:MAG: gltC 1 [Alphaproteobacteria bacterium]|nr:gltC 1 [Alphaproteobacteria bacterium]